MTVQATEQAAAVAAQALDDVPHGDNAPDRTEALRIDRAVVDRLVPPLPPPAPGRPMCWSWRGRS